MLALNKEDITKLFVWLDDNLPKVRSVSVGRPSSLKDSELLTLLIWNTLSNKNPIIYIIKLIP